MARAFMRFVNPSRVRMMKTISFSTSPTEPSTSPGILAMVNGCASVGRLLTDGSSTYYRPSSITNLREMKGCRAYRVLARFPSESPLQGQPDRVVRDELDRAMRVIGPAPVPDGVIP